MKKQEKRKALEYICICFSLAEKFLTQHLHLESPRKDTETWRPSRQYQRRGANG